jgi:2'-5' RNA ligase
MRLFVACDFSPETLAKVSALAQELRASLSGLPVRWVSPSSYHLTLQFLGEIAAGKIKFIEPALHDIAAQHNRIPVEFDNLGCFPSLKQPQVIWLGLRPNPRLNRLAQDLREALGALGFTDDSRFKAHLTLGRLDKYAAEEHKARLRAQVEAGKDLKIGADEFSEIVLYRSVLKPGGPVYTALYHARLENMLN